MAKMTDVSEWNAGERPGKVIVQGHHEAYTLWGLTCRGLWPGWSPGAGATSPGLQSGCVDKP